MAGFFFTGGCSKIRAVPPMILPPHSSGCEVTNQSVLRLSPTAITTGTGKKGTGFLARMGRQQPYFYVLSSAASYAGPVTTI